jgi:hypothetical protein
VGAIAVSVVDLPENKDGCDVGSCDALTWMIKLCDVYCERDYACAAGCMLDRINGSILWVVRSMKQYIKCLVVERRQAQVDAM